MTVTVMLHCRCGAVRGTVAEASPRTVNRVVCYCADCQSFAQALGRPDLLDQAGGSDIVQIAAGRMSIETGQQHIRGLRLTPQGSYRWYAACCNTPVGNMARLRAPALGIHATAFNDSGQNPNDVFGAPLGAIRGEQSTGRAPSGSAGLPLGVLIRAVPKVLYWKITGLDRPNPFLLEGSEAPIFPVEVRGIRTA